MPFTHRVNIGFTALTYWEERRNRNVDNKRLSGCNERNI